MSVFCPAQFEVWQLHMLLHIYYICITDKMLLIWRIYVGLVELFVITHNLHEL